MPHTLLLADDSVTIQRVIELTFADEDVQVIAVSDGDQAIARIDAKPPDIILADVGMPGKNGYEVAQHVKQTPHLAHIPVVLLTGAFEPVDQARAAAAGCEGVLAKPFEPQLVIGRVRELLGKSRPAAAPLDNAPVGPQEPAAPSWAPPLSDQLFTTPDATAPPAPSGDLGNYFDRLDQAFADLTTSSPAPPAASGAADVDWFKTAQPAESASVAEQWDIGVPPVAPADLPLSHTSALPDFDQRSSAPREAPPVRQPPAPPTAVASPLPASPAPAAFAGSPPAPPAVEPVAPPVLPAASLPPIADAFAALLAAEQSAAQPLAAPAWPAAPTQAPATDQVVEEVVKRVLDRLSDRVVKDAVRELVSDVAERVIREEIERLKASIR